MSGKLEGVFTPALVPFDAHSEINEAELRRLVHWLIDKGVHGLHMNGATGEATRLTAEERRRIVKIACEAAEDRVPVIAGTAEANARETLDCCELYAKCGARAVAVVSPFYYKLSQDSLYAHFSEIAKNSPIDILLYNIPAFATPIELATIRKLCELERIVGIKDSTGDVSSMMRMISVIRPLRPEFSFLAGWDAVLVPMLLVGCDGGTCASGNVIPEQLRRMLDLVRAGNNDEAVRQQYRMFPIFDRMLQQFEFPDGFRAGAELRGFSFGVTRQPLNTTQLERRRAQVNGLRVALAEFVQ